MRRRCGAGVFIPAAFLHKVWGSQFWLQPAFQPAFARQEDSDLLMLWNLG
jgi:hypothetical protein